MVQAFKPTTWGSPNVEFASPKFPVPSSSSVLADKKIFCRVDGKWDVIESLKSSFRCSDVTRMVVNPGDQYTIPGAKCFEKRRSKPV